MPATTWKVKLGEEYFTDKDYPGAYDDKSKRRSRRYSGRIRTRCK